MFETPFLGQVRLRMSQSQSAPTPASSDPRFAVPAEEQTFVPTWPVYIPLISGLAYPPQYPPDRFDCVVSEDGLTWICTPRAGVPVPLAVGPVYPVVPFGRVF